MSTSGDRPFLSRPAVAVAAASSCALVVIAALGGLSAPVVAIALGVACALAVVSYREAQPERLAHAVRPLHEGDRPVVIRAPKAAEIAGPGQSKTDAA